MNTRDNSNLERAVLAGGCFWGMQDLIRKLPGGENTRLPSAGTVHGPESPTYIGGRLRFAWPRSARAAAHADANRFRLAERGARCRAVHIPPPRRPARVR